MNSLEEILTALIAKAKANPDEAFTQSLRGGLGVAVRIDTNQNITLWVNRYGVEPADLEMTTTLRKAHAPVAALNPETWSRGISQRSNRHYITTQWLLQPELPLIPNEDPHD